MSTSLAPSLGKPIGWSRNLRNVGRQNSAILEKAFHTTAQKRASYPSLEERTSTRKNKVQFQFEPPTPGFRPSQAIKQNRFETGLKKIPSYPAPPSAVKRCQNPINTVFEDQLKLLDPNGARTRLFSDANPERVQPGDILLVRLKSGDPFSGVCIEIRKRNSPIDTSILLRNALTRVGVEMWYKVYSPNVEGIEIVQRKEKRARRAKLTYMRKPKHDRGSVENIVRAYQRQRLGINTAKSTKDRSASLPKKQKKVKKS